MKNKLLIRISNENYSFGKPIVEIAKEKYTVLSPRLRANKAWVRGAGEGYLLIRNRYLAVVVMKK